MAFFFRKGRKESKSRVARSLSMKFWRASTESSAEPGIKRVGGSIRKLEDSKEGEDMILVHVVVVVVSEEHSGGSESDIVPSRDCSLSATTTFKMALRHAVRSCRQFSTWKYGIGNIQTRFLSSTSRQCPSCSASLPTRLPTCPNCFHIEPLPPTVSYFELFDLPSDASAFRVDTRDLRARFLHAQRLCHPDVWSGKGKVRCISSFRPFLILMNPRKYKA